MTRHRSRPALAGLHEFDLRAFGAVAGTSHPLLDTTMRPLSAAADHGKLWFAAAALLAASGDPALQRGAVRGVLTLGAASLVTNQVGKRLNRRRRPDPTGVSPRRLRRQPRSSSFPSGHAASAAAFAVGVGIEHRGAGAALGVLAAAVGLSRVATGAHYPGDVVAGFAVGGGLAALGARLVRPVEDFAVEIPAPQTVDQPPRPEGAGLVVLVNPASGSGTGAELRSLIERELPAAEIVELAEDDDLDALSRDAAGRAEVLGVVGGDGTVATVARQAVAAGRPLAVFPGGTFNHFAKDIGCGTAAETVAAVRDGRAAAVDVVRLGDDQLILNTSSIGVYPDFVRVRERLEHGLGKPAAALRAGLHVLRHSDPVTVDIDGRRVDTLFFFLGNSLYGAPGFFPGSRTRLDDGLIDVRYLETGHRFEALRIAASWLSGRIRASRLYREAQVPEFTITAPAQFRVAHDGEAGELTTTATFRVDGRALTVFGTSVVP